MAMDPDLKFILDQIVTSIENLAKNERDDAVTSRIAIEKLAASVVTTENCRDCKHVSDKTLDAAKVEAAKLVAEGKLDMAKLVADAKVVNDKSLLAIKEEIMDAVHIVATNAIDRRWFLGVAAAMPIFFTIIAVAVKYV